MQKPHTGSQQVFSSTVMHFKLKAQILWVVLFNFASFKAFCPGAVQSAYFPVTFPEGKRSLCRLASSCVLRGRLWTKQRVSVSCITGHRFSKPLFELRPDAGCTVLAAVRHQAFRLGSFLSIWSYRMSDQHQDSLFSHASNRCWRILDATVLYVLPGKTLF